MTLIVNSLTNSAPSITNVDCETFEVEYGQEYDCEVTISDPDTRDTLHIITDPELYGFPREIETGTQTVSFYNDGSTVGEQTFTVNVQDDNWGDDPIGEL